jgi:hypothetical protein
MKRSLHAFLLVVALLLAQLGAVAHAAGHSRDAGLPSDSACELCVGYAQIAGAAPLPAQMALPLCTTSQKKPETAAAVFFTQSVFHSRARAPPVFS